MANGDNGLTGIMHVAPDLAEEFVLRGDTSHMDEVVHHAFNALSYQMKREKLRDIYSKGMEIQITVRPMPVQEKI